MSRRLVMVLDSAEGDAEGVIIDTDTEGAIVLELDTGQRLTLDETELRSALDRQAA